MSQEGGQARARCYAQNVMICWIDMLRSLGRGGGGRLDLYLLTHRLSFKVMEKDTRFGRKLSLRLVYILFSLFNDVML